MHIKKKWANAQEKDIYRCFLKKVSREKYGGLWTSLEKNFSRGTKQYPTTLSEAYSMVCSHTPEHRDGKHNMTFPGRRPDGCNPSVQPSGLSLLQHEGTIAGTNGELFPTITCFKCKKRTLCQSLSRNQQLYRFQCITDRTRWRR